MGNNHVVDLTGITYNSNPPTSGPHFPVWAKGGVYDRVISDGHLIHSLEHGYIVISYDCEKEVSSTPFDKTQGYPERSRTDSKYQVPNVYAHEGEKIDIPEGAEEAATESGDLLHMKVGLSGEMSAFTPENAPAPEVVLPDVFGDQECKDIVSNLSSFLNDWERIIIVPRLGMDTKIALTAWGRIMKIDQFDKGSVESFIRVFHNQGPEKTVE